ncbi:RNA polymerase sigma factor [Streptomyces mirabilis]|uniref:RNA polymerase sigma factor n=1 Tax=Streptomyces mirabilis TaxID=68239 RepID=UPI0033193329
MITKYEGDGVDPPTQAIHPKVMARFTEALKEVHPRIDHVVARMVRDRHLREDIVQHVDIALYLHIKRDDAFREPIIAWAYVVAKNKAISEFRRLAPEVAAGELPETSRLFQDPHAGDPTAGIAFFELLQDVERAIADTRQYKVWEMTHVAQLTGVEIGRSLGISAATVSRDLSRAMTKASNIEH